jgi:glycosyltransferase involved in cell wall biosynthesis
MRICITTNEVYEPRFNQAAGGVPVAVRTLTDEFRRMGHDVIVITDQKGKQRPLEILSNGTVVLIDWMKRKENNLHRLMRRWHIPKWRAYEYADPDVFNQQMEGRWQYWSYYYKPNTPHVITLQYPVDKEQGDLKLHDKKVLHTFTHADRIITASTCFMNELLEELPFLKNTNIELVHNPVKVPEENDYIQKSDKLNVLWLHRAVPRKQPEKFVDLARGFPDIEFHMAGRALNEFKLDNLPDNLTVHNYVSHEDKIKLYKDAQIFVCTSRGEGLPVVFTEALSYKCALLSTPLVNPENMVSKFGIVDADLTRGLTNLLETNYKKLGENGLKYVRKEHNPRKIAKKYIEVFESAIRK